MRIRLKMRLQLGKTELKGLGFVGPNIWYSSVLDPMFLMNQIVLGQNVSCFLWFGCLVLRRRQD